MLQGKELNIDLGHLCLTAKLWGNPEAKPILVLHGWLDNAASFDFLAPLIDDAYIVALDFPGHGKSDHFPSGMQYHLLDIVRMMFEVIDVLGFEKPTVMGHSLGAAIATLMAASMPDRLDSLILIDAIGPLSEAVAKGPQRLGLAVRKIIEAGAQSRRPYKTQAAMIETRMAANGLSEAAAKALVLRGSQETEQGWEWLFDPRLLLPSLLYLTEEQVLTFLEEITIPVLLLVGEKGILIGNPMLDLRIAKVKNMTHTVLQGTHHLHMDSATMVAQSINRFKEKVHAGLSNY
jgi:pimeloyl-ACP methyl ester carboxylesterase